MRTTQLDKGSAVSINEYRQFLTGGRDRPPDGTNMEEDIRRRLTDSGSTHNRMERAALPGEGNAQIMKMGGKLD